MSDIKPLADAIFRERVERARRMTPGQKIALGFTLFEQSCGLMRSGIHMQFPDADETEVQRIFRQRLDTLRRIHEHGIYTYRPMTPEEAGEA